MRKCLCLVAVISSHGISRLYAVLSLYLIVCSFALTGQAIKNIPSELSKLSDQSVGSKILFFLKPPVGSLVVALISTFGIYFFASFLYVRTLVTYVYVLH